MKLLVILSLTSLLALASGLRFSSGKRRRHSSSNGGGGGEGEAKSEIIIHHEYHGPGAPLSKDGRVVDTPEVAEAKANHLEIHRETKEELSRLMAELNALDVELKKEEPKKAAEEQPKAAEEASAGGGSESAQPEAAPIVAAPVEMTPELMAILSAAAGAEEQAQQQQGEEAAAPAAESGGAEAEGEAAKQAEAAAPEQPAQEEAAKQEEAKPVVEVEANNEVDAENPITIAQKNYEGPLAPLSEDGRVVDTIEVRKAKEAHLIAYEQAVKLAKLKKAEESSAESEPAWYEQRKKIFIPPVYLLYHHDGPIGYTGPKAPLGQDGRVVDTEEVKRAALEHKKAYEHAENIAKRHPPKPEDNAV